MKKLVYKLGMRASLGNTVASAKPSFYISETSGMGIKKERGYLPIIKNWLKPVKDSYNTSPKIYTNWVNSVVSKTIKKSYIDYNLN